MSEDQFNPNSEPSENQWVDYALPEEGVADLTDRLTEFLRSRTIMTRRSSSGRCWTTLSTSREPCRKTSARKTPML